MIVRLATFRGAAEIMSNLFDWNTENCLQIVFYSIAQCGATTGGGQKAQELQKSGWPGGSGGQTVQRNQFKLIALMLAHYKCTTSTLTATTKDVGFSTIFELFLT